MATQGAWLGASRRLILSFVLALLVPATAVVWLGVRLIEQDRALASRQLRERRESAADRLIAGLEQAVSSTERRLDGEPTGLLIQPDDDAVLVTLRPSGIEAYPRDRLLYLPVIPPGPAEPTAAFEAGEALEFRAKDYRGAEAAFRALATSPSAAVRAGALLRLARTLRKTGRADEALRVYAELAHIPDARLSGLPADLVARRARCVLLQELGRGAELGEEARSLQADLVAARWPLDHGTFLAYSEQINHWVGAKQPVAADRDALSAASEWIWQQWAGADRAEFHVAGRRALRFAGVGVTVLWQSSGDRLVVLVAGPRFQQREWFDAPRSPLDARGLRVALADADGQAVLGTLPTDVSATERRTSAVTSLPWTVFVGSADVAADLDDLANRRRLLLAGLALLVGLVIAGGYFIVRAVSREFAVAQLQSDFVSAVSHEFRTPLTSLRQFTDLLNDDPDLPAGKRRTFYQAQARATERLRRLVESLLDFGRMEAGARPYRLERLSTAPLVRGIVEDFRRDGAPDGFTVEASIGEDIGAVDVDPDALARAVWNLLDNAIKYSGSSRTVSVNVEVRDGSVAISVCDRGLGIPRHEHDEIFKKFVRGTASRAHSIKGTGIGLAMVRHIVEAHGGTVRVESAPGEGSTFTIVLPATSESPGVTAGLQPPRAVEEGDTPRWLAS
jgi:signal transduction histidine kinase